MTITNQQRILWHRLQAALFYWLWLPGLVIGSGLAIDHWLGLRRWPHGPMVTGASLIILAAGLALIVWSGRDLQHLGDGTASPAQPTRRLVASGSYRLCRHPMSLGYNLVGGAVVLLMASPAMIVVSYPLLLIWQGRFLRQEEKILARRFRQDYPTYQAKTPFIIPLPPLSRR